MSQVSYLAEQGQVGIGVLADCGIKDVGSYKNTTGAAIPFGTAVVQGSTFDSVARPTTLAGAVIVGIVVHSHVDNSNNDVFPSGHVAYGITETTLAGVPDKQMVNVLRRGRVWVHVEEAIAIGDPVLCRFVAAGAEVLGAFRNDQDGTDCGVVPNARWIAPSQGSGTSRVALLEFGLPVPTVMTQA